MYTEVKQISVRVTPEEFEKLCYHCDTAHTSKNQVIRNWIQNLPSPPKPKSKKRAKTN
jgi:hypothetical protein